MSGHSHWATIQRSKGVKDAARGKIFSKLSKQISIAVKEGGGPDIDSNFKLRVIVEAARAANMPKDNIERAISKGSGEGANLAEVLYEGFGPSGVGVLIEATTDNRNRTAQELKNVLERSGGSMGGPNSVSFNFVNRGFLLIAKKDPIDEQLLTIIDSGAEDFSETEDGIELYTEPSNLLKTKEDLSSKGFEVLESKLIKKPVNTIELSEKDSDKLMALVGELNTLDDVSEVFVAAS